MFTEEMKHITLSGETFPVKCDLLVLEKLQDRYGDIWEFEEKIIFWEKRDDGKTYDKLPEDIGAVNYALYLMVKEGIEIENETAEEKRTQLTMEQLIRKADVTPMEAARIVHDEFKECFKTKNR